MDKRSYYITAEGEKRLRDELRWLWKTERVLVTKRVSDAAKEGDRSENAEYIYSKKRLREIDRRIRYLTKRLESIQVVHKLPADQTKIYFGCWVELTNNENTTVRYRLVGSDEFDMQEQYISIDSPMAQALIGKQTKDTIVLHLETGNQSWSIVKIQYCE